MNRSLSLVPLILVAMASRAHAAPATLPSSGELRIAGALFTPTRVDDGIEWHAHWVLTPESAADLDGKATRKLRFALPLEDGESLDPTFGVTPMQEGDHVVGVHVDRAALDGRTVSAVFHQRVALRRADLHLGAPVAAGTALQIVDGDLGAGTRFEIETGQTLERSVGFVAVPGVGHAAREEARRLTGYGARVTGAALYVRGEDVKAANGITAAVVTPRARGRNGSIAMAIVFASVVAVMIAAAKKLRNAAGVERADALLAAEVDALDAEDRRKH